MNVSDLRAFEDLLRLHYPQLRIEFKDKSLTQRLIGALIRPFNPQYLTRYTSTFAPTVYFPSREAYEDNPKASFTLLAHEFVHLLDTQEHPFWFRLSYMIPPALAPIPFGVYLWLAGAQAWPLALLFGVLLVSTLISQLSVAAFFVSVTLGLGVSCWAAVAYSGWYSVLFFLGLTLLAPWPAPGRVHWEKRGYAMTIAIYQWTLGGVPKLLRESVIRYFLGPFYYFMSWRRADVTAWVDQTVVAASSGELAAQDPYRIVYDFLQSRNALR